MNGKFLTKETTGLVVDVINESVNNKVPFFLRPLVKPALNVGMNLFNKYADKIIPDKIDALINSSITKAHAGDWNGAAKDIGIAGDSLVDIKFINDENEEKLFVSIAQSLVQGIKTWIESKKKPE